MFLSIVIFLGSCFLIVLGGKWVVSSISKISRYLEWKEFVAAFFAISLGSVAPEFIIGINSALHGVPELSLGNIVGQNILLLSLTVAVSAFILKDGIKIESRTVRTGTVFAVCAALLPFFLLADGELSRIDGVLLIMTFLGFAVWLFSKKERFSKIYEDDEEKIGLVGGLKGFTKSLALLVGGLVLIVVAAEGIILTSLQFSEVLAFSIPFVGILIVAAGTGLPETYVAVNLARKGQSWMILGGLMGAVALSSTLILGVVALIHPIAVTMSEVPHLALARIFLVICAILFLFFVRTGKAVSKKEAFILFSIYVLFVLLSIFVI